MTQEDMGFNSDAKEAVAFAILANEAINGHFNNIPKATGAKHPVVMGKICM
jgi:anhydro-N-acetylmuramic acid kinase